MEVFSFLSRSVSVSGFSVWISKMRSIVKRVSRAAPSEKKKRRQVSLSVLMLFGERRNENKNVSLMALNWVFRLSFGGRCRALLFEHVILLPATTGVLSRGLSKLIIAHFHFNGCWCRFVWVERFYCLREALFKLLLNDDGCWVDDEWECGRVEHAPSSSSKKR